MKDFLLWIGGGYYVCKSDVQRKMASGAPLVGRSRSWRRPWFPCSLGLAGSARTVLEAIERHGGEAQPARERFKAMSDKDKKALLKFLETL